MSLIPGTLPSGACYGTPQELLDLFAQYLDIPAFAVSSKVLYSATTPIPNTDFVWIDTAGGDTPIVNFYNEIVGNYQPFPFVGGVGANERLISDKTAITALDPADLFLVSEWGGTYFGLKKITASDLADNLSRIVQVVEGSTTTPVTVSTTTPTDTGLTVTITPKSSSNKVLILITQSTNLYRAQSSQAANLKVLRGVTTLYAGTTADMYTAVGNSTSVQMLAPWSFFYLDSPATVAATTYKVQGNPTFTSNGGYAGFQSNGERSTILAIEVRV